MGNRAIVVKYGGHAMTDAVLKHKFIAELVSIASSGSKPVLVHGGGPEITKAMRKAGKEPVFANGLRVTDAETMEIAEMVLSGKTNKGIVSLVNSLGGSAVGISGKDASLLFAEAIAELGLVGRITRVNPKIVLDLLRCGYLPVVSPIAIGPAGESLNINADIAAGEIAAALDASALVMLTDVPGVFADPKDRSTLISELSLQDAKQMISSGKVSKGMIPKIEACEIALRAGVRTTCIIDGTAPGALTALLAGETIGTRIVG